MLIQPHPINFLKAIQIETFLHVQASTINNFYSIYLLELLQPPEIWIKSTRTSSKKQVESELGIGEDK